MTSPQKGSSESHASKTRLQKRPQNPDVIEYENVLKKLHAKKKKKIGRKIPRKLYTPQDDFDIEHENIENIDIKNVIGD